MSGPVTDSYKTQPGTDGKGKKTMSALFDEAIKSINDVSTLPTSNTPTMINPMPYAQQPYMMFNPAMNMMPRPNFAPPQMQPNDMMYLNFLAQFSQYQGYMQQMQKGQVPMPQTMMPAMEQRLPTSNQMPEPMPPASPALQISKKATPTACSKSRYSELQAELESINAEKPEELHKNTEEVVSAPEVCAAPTPMRRPVQEKREVEVSDQKNPENVRGVNRNRRTEKPTVDDIPIRANNKPFEQIIEEKLCGTSKQKDELGLGRAAETSAGKSKKPVGKKQFLKRKSQAVKLASTAKKFNYFSDKFERDGATATEVEQMADDEKKAVAKRRKGASGFLTKGKGTGGGIIGKPSSSSKAKPKSTPKPAPIDDVEQDAPEEEKKIVVKLAGKGAVDMRTSVAEFEKLEEECKKGVPKTAEDMEQISLSEIQAVDEEPEPERKQTKKEPTDRSATSHLIKEFFSGGDNDVEFNEQQNEQKEPEEPEEEEAEREKVPDKRGDAALIKSKLKELTDELEKLKGERKKVKKQKTDYDKIYNKLQEDVAEFEAMKEKELASIAELKEKETKRLNQEKRVLERQNKAMQSIPNKKEKEEVDSLKKENAKLHEDAKAKESRYKLLLDKIKRQLEDVLGKNQTLEDQVKELNTRVKELEGEKIVKVDTKKKEKENTKPRIEAKNDVTPAENIKQVKSVAKPKLSVPEKPIKNDSQEPETKKMMTKIVPITENSSEHESEPPAEDELHENNSPDMMESEADVGNEYDRSEMREESLKLQKKAEVPAKNKNSPSMASVEDECGSKAGKGEDEEKYDMVFLQKYHAKNVKLVSQRVFNDGKISKQYENGKTEIIFSNGVRRETFSDGYSTIYFNNQDIKQVRIES